VTFLDIALANVARGFRVFPCKPRDKKPLTAHGFKDASSDTEQITAWWTKQPSANVAIACGASGLTVVDIDHGLTDLDSFKAWREAAGLPDTYTVRTGRRPDFGVQMYFRGTMPDVGLFELGGCSGQIKSLGGYVMAAGSVHPSGETYQEISSAEIADLPEVVRNLRTAKSLTAARERGTKIRQGEGQHAWLTSVAGGLRNKGIERDALEAALIPINESELDPPLPSEDVSHIAESVSRYDVPAPDPAVVLGQPKKPVQLFHSRDEAEHAPNISFAVDGFLQNEGITGLSAPPGQRKTIILLNVVRSLLTGEPLFGKFKVLEHAQRIIYLTPEVSLSPFVSRLRQFGLMDYVGGRCLFRTLSAQGKLALYAPELLEAVRGAHVILDTVPRFVEGDENDAEDIRQLGENLFAVLQAGARSVIGAFHMPKGAKKNDYFDLETCVRGSGDLGALLSACWGTRLQDEKDVYHCPSYMECVKQRDFEACAPFELLPSKSGILTAREGNCVVSLAPGLGNRQVVNKDGHESIAVEFIRSHPELSLREMEQGMASLGIARKKDWISRKRKALLSTDATDKPVALSASHNQKE
jgi:Bifunctional DNA primase/polymerase, N-terminal/AAA domain/Primase C terminal 1 (PriCT-1)